MIKIFLLDADGVVLEPRKKYFSQRLAEDFGIPSEKVMEFFKNDFHACLVGQADVRERLEKYIADWGWRGSVDELLEYWHAGEKTINKPVVEIIKNLQSRGIRCYLATSQAKTRADYLWNAVGLKDILDGSFFSCDIGHDKTDRKYFEAIQAKLNVPYEDMSFWDDKKTNVDTAASLGIDSHAWIGLKEFRAFCTDLLRHDS